MADYPTAGRMVMKNTKLAFMQVVLGLAISGLSSGQETIGFQPSADEMTNVLESIASNQISIRARAMARTGSAGRKEAFKKLGAALLQAAEGRVAQRAPGLWQEAYVQAMPNEPPAYGRPAYNPFAAGQSLRLRSADGAFSIV